MPNETAPFPVAIAEGGDNNPPNDFVESIVPDGFDHPENIVSPEEQVDKIPDAFINESNDIFEDSTLSNNPFIDEHVDLFEPEVNETQLKTSTDGGEQEPPTLTQITLASPPPPLPPNETQVSSEHAPKNPLLAEIELSPETESKNKGYIKNENGELVQVETTVYKHKTTAVTAAETAYQAQEVEQYLREELGYEDIGFTVHSSESGKLEDLEGRNVYILVHGWTGSEEIYSIPGQQIQPEGTQSGSDENRLTAVETLIALDAEKNKNNPDYKPAVVITVNAHGFKDSKLTPQALAAEDGRYLSPENSALALNYLVTEGLGVDVENVTAVGHSLGGATVEILKAKYGFEAVAQAPALYASAENIKALNEFKAQFGEDTQQQKQSFTEKAKEAIKRVGVQSETDVIYQTLGNALKVGEAVKNTSVPGSGVVAEQAVAATVRATLPILAGSDHTGNPEIDKQIGAKLQEIHLPEFTQNTETTAKSIIKLQEGIDFSDWTLEELLRLRETQEVHGDNDNLVAKRAVRNLKQVTAHQLFIRISELNDSKGKITPEFAKRLNNQLEGITHDLYGLESNDKYLKVVKGGHYAAVLQPDSYVAAVELANKNKQLPLAA